MRRSAYLLRKAILVSRDAIERLHSSSLIEAVGVRAILILGLRRVFPVQAGALAGFATLLAARHFVRDGCDEQSAAPASPPQAVYLHPRLGWLACGRGVAVLVCVHGAASGVNWDF